MLNGQTTKVVLACGLCAGLIAQENQPVIRVTTRLVQVNVVVHDRKGEPVADLAKDDFVLFDKGKEQKIGFFLMDSKRAQPNPIPKLPANIYSNRASHQADTPSSVTVILLDGVNTRFQDQAVAKAQLLKFLRQIKPEDRVALYALGSNLKILHDFTNTPDHLIKALGKYGGRIATEQQAGEPDPIDPTGNDDLDKFLADTDHVISDFQNVNRAKFTLSAMEAIANHLAGLPGRKNLVWFSGGFPFTLGLDIEEYSSDPRFERRTFSEETERVTRAMNNAGIAIYPVDARGLIAPQDFNAAIRSSPIRPGRPLPRSTPKNIDTMQILADGTGGRAFYNTNDLEGAIRKAVDDSAVTYTLGFYSSSDDWDGKFHKLKVEVKRKGVDVRYRKGYLAIKDQAPTEKQRNAQLREAVTSPIEATAIAINARTDPSDKPDQGTLRLITQIFGQDITLQPEGERWVGTVDMVFVQRAADGTVVGNLSQTLNLNLLKPRYDALIKDGMVVTKYLTPDPKAYQIRVIVYDRPSGNVGSIYIPVKPAK